MVDEQLVEIAVNIRVLPKRRIALEALAEVHNGTVSNVVEAAVGILMWYLKVQGDKDHRALYVGVNLPDGSIEYDKVVGLGGYDALDDFVLKQIL